MATASDQGAGDERSKWPQPQPVNFKMWFAEDVPLPPINASLEEYDAFHFANQEAAWGREAAARLGLETDIFGFCHYQRDVDQLSTMPEEYWQHVFSLQKAPTQQVTLEHSRVARRAFPKPIARLAKENLALRPAELDPQALAVKATKPKLEVDTGSSQSSTSEEAVTADTDNTTPTLASSDNSEGQQFQASNNSPDSHTDYDKYARLEQALGLRKRSPTLSRREAAFGDALHASFKKSIDRRKNTDQQSENLPEAENCALWLGDLPVDITEARLLARIRVGAVFAVNINAATGEHKNAAAKVVFMKPEGARNLMHVLKSNEGFNFGYLRAHGVYNKFGYRACTIKNASRVIQIKGPFQYMERDLWETYFRKYFQFQVVEVRNLRTTVEGEAVIEFQFARVDGQSSCAYQTVAKDPRFKGLLSVRYAADPCDPNSGYR